MSAAITYVAFLEAVRALDISGVRTLNEPPASLAKAKLPVMFPVMPTGDRADYLSSCIASAKTRGISIVVVLGPVSLATMADNYDDIAALMDATEAALDSWTLTNYIDYTITASGNVQVGEHVYWGLEVDITARDYK